MDRQVFQCQRTSLQHQLFHTTHHTGSHTADINVFSRHFTCQNVLTGLQRHSRAVFLRDNRRFPLSRFFKRKNTVEIYIAAPEDGSGNLIAAEEIHHTAIRISNGTEIGSCIGKVKCAAVLKCFTERQRAVIHRHRSKIFQTAGFIDESCSVSNRQ